MRSNNRFFLLFLLDDRIEIRKTVNIWCCSCIDSLYVRIWTMDILLCHPPDRQLTITLSLHILFRLTKMAENTPSQIRTK